MGAGSTLVKRRVNLDKYAGQYVATDAEENGNLVGHGSTPLQAIRMAEKKGCRVPYVFYVSDKAAVHIY